MKVCILVPSESSLNQAGVRIRYNNIARFFESNDTFLDVRPITDFYRAKSFNYDIFIFSKCYDASALVLAKSLQIKGKKVGVDIFDDYFSQRENARLARYRLWLAQFSKSCDFCICSTKHMKNVISTYMPSIPTHILNDPYDTLCSGTLSDTLDTKAIDWKERRTLKIGWFGMGDNPHFPVGINDLCSLANDLVPLQQLGIDITFELLTNERSLTPENLGLLQRLPFDYTIELWSEQKEAEKLSEWLVCVLPVNAQAFSVGKSMNRAVTALTSGTQVISLGYPLYIPLHDFIYRSVSDFVHDLLADVELKLASANLAIFLESIEDLADPNVEALNLRNFLLEHNEQLPVMPVTKKDPLRVVLHGKTSNGTAHKLIQSAKGFSVASPFNKLILNFDLRIVFNKKNSELELYLCSKTLSSRLTHLKNDVIPASKFAQRKYYKVKPEYFDCDTHCFVPQSFDLNSPVGMATSYDLVMQNSIKMLKKIMPSLNLIISEQSTDAWFIGETIQHG